MTRKKRNRLKEAVEHLKQHTDKGWYSLALGFIAAIDNFIFVIPLDGLLVSSVLLNPNRWKKFFPAVALGSALGGTLLAAAIERYGIGILLKLAPGIDHSVAWKATVTLMDKHGLLALGLLVASPIMQQPGVALAATAKKPLIEIFAVIVGARFVKSFAWAWAASRAPNLVKKIFRIKDRAPKPHSPL